MGVEHGSESAWAQVATEQAEVSRVEEPDPWADLIHAAADADEDEESEEAEPHAGDAVDADPLAPMAPESPAPEAVLSSVHRVNSREEFGSRGPPRVPGITSGSHMWEALNAEAMRSSTTSTTVFESELIDCLV